MNCDSLKDWVVLLEFQSLWGILLILRRNVTRSSRNTGCFLLCALKDNLNACVFNFL